MLKIIIGIVFAPFFCGLILLIKKRNSKNNASVFLFHHITKNQKVSHSLSEISEKKFKKICMAISNSQRNVVPIRDRKNSEDLTITFDDGFSSNMAAAKILEELHLNATFFVCTAHLSNEVVTDVYGSQQRLSRENIKELHDRGFEIGSHTVHHFDMTIVDEETLYSELKKSKDTLESIIGDKIESLSLPYGLWNEKIIETAKEIGYRYFSVYNFTKQAKKIGNVFPATGVYPFDSVNDLKDKIEGKSGNAMLRAGIIPHFAKGSPLAAFSSLYRKIPVPWFTHRKKNKQSDNKEN